MSTPAFDVIVCGSLHLDIMLYAPSLPRLDETVTESRWAQQCGGKGGNQAVMAARAGARVAMIGRVGADDFGSRLRANLDTANINSSAVQIDSVAGSGMSAAIVRDDGDYGAVIVSGANLRIDPDAVAENWRALGGARVLILQNEIPELVNMAAARVANENSALVVLNAAPARSMSPDLLDRVDLLVVNRVEAGMLSGRVVRDRADAVAALPDLRGSGKNIVVTLGGDGLVVKGGDGDSVWLAPHHVKVVSTHGAGDCFVGALSAQLAQGAKLIDAATFANRAAASYVARDRLQHV